MSSEDPDEADDPVQESPSADRCAATEQALNRSRMMAAHAPAVTLDRTLDAGLQSAALIMAANDSLRHNPPNTWTCWNDAGSTGASHSNLALNGRILYACEAIQMYLDDGAIPSVGHRI